MNRNNKKSKKNKPKNMKLSFKRLLTYFKPYRLAFSLIMLLSIASTILMIFTPKILGSATTAIYDGLKSGSSIDFEKLGKILLFLIVINVASAMLMFVAQFFIASYSQKIIFDLRMEVNNKLEKLPLKYYDSNSFGDIISRVTNDIDNISNMLRNGLTQFISASVLIVGVIYMMFSISFYMTIIAILTLPLSIFATKLVVGKSQKYFKQKQDILGRLNGHIEETFSSLITIKSYNKEADILNEFTDLNKDLAHKGIMSSFLSSVIMPVMTFISNFGYVLVSIVGAILFMKGSISIGNIQAFLQYTRQFGRPISQVASISNLLQSTIASAERLFELLDEEELDLSYSKTLPADLNGNIKFDHIKFGYTEKLLMKDISLEIKSGETIAVIGPTGAGKTTLVNLLMRFYDVNDGIITVDGIDIRDVERAELRRQFGMVLQDTWLFNGSIYENIAYSKEGASREEVMKAAKIAKAHHFIMTQAKGYDTIINEEASNISAGQKQLITIARAVLADPNILILDEATSSVDTRTETLIKKGLDNLSKGKTTFIIAHRLSTIKNADKVILMKNGNIEKMGSYEEVLG